MLCTAHFQESPKIAGLARHSNSRLECSLATRVACIQSRTHRKSLRSSEVLLRRGACQRRGSDGSKGAVRVKGYNPDNIGAQRGENEGHLDDVEKSEKQKSIRQKAPPDDELSIPANVQE